MDPRLALHCRIARSPNPLPSTSRVLLQVYVVLQWDSRLCLCQANMPLTELHLQLSYFKCKNPVKTKNKIQRVFKLNLAEINQNDMTLDVLVQTMQMSSQPLAY